MKGNYPSDSPVSDFLDGERLNKDQIIEDLSVTHKIRPKKMVIRGRTGHEFIPLGEILYFKAARNYCEIHMENGDRKLSSVPLSYILKTLNIDFFVQCHRSFAININKITAVNGNMIFLDFNKSIGIPMSQRYRNDLRFESF